MREFSTNLENVLFNNDGITYFFLIKLSFSQDYFLTSFSENVTYQGDTYIADSGILETESPKFSNVVDRESYKIVVSDIDRTMMTEFRTGVIGKDIEVMIGFVDANGNPLTQDNDIQKLYRGYVDSPTISNDFEQISAVLEGTSPMADLDSVNDFISSKDGMDQKSGTDTSFDAIFKDNEIKLKWGKS